MATQYTALKDIRHDDLVVKKGGVLPSAWVDEFEEMQAINRMVRNGQLQVVPEGSDLEETMPQPPQPVYTDMTTEEAGRVRELADRVPEEEAIEMVREQMAKEAEEKGFVLTDPQQGEMITQPEGDEVRDLEVDSGFDPSEHTVNEVMAFVRENPEAATDVMDAEGDGKDRSTLIAWLENFIEEQTEPDAQS